MQYTSYLCEVWNWNDGVVLCECLISHWGVNSTTFDPELRNESFALISFMGFPTILSTLLTFQICIFNRKNSKLTFSNGSQLMGIWFMANLHASLDSTCKSRISKISTRCQNGGSIPQLLTLNSEMNLKLFSNPGGPFHNFLSWTQKWI